MVYYFFGLALVSVGKKEDAINALEMAFLFLFGSALIKVDLACVRAIQ